MAPSTTAPDVSKTVVFQTREVYTTSQKNPRQKYHFIFEIEAEIVGEMSDFGDFSIPN